MYRSAAVIALSGFLLSAANAQPLPDTFLAPPETLSAEASNFLEAKLDGPFFIKTHRRAKDLLLGDFNSDGLKDIAVVTNERSLLEIHHSREAEAPAPFAFETREFTLDRIIRSAGMIDLRGDGKQSILLVGSPASLLIAEQDSEGRLQPPSASEIEADRIAIGDLTGDGHDDLLVYHARGFRIFGRENGELSFTSVQRFHTVSEPNGEIMLLDLNGDGRLDIVYPEGTRNDSFVVRLQTENGTFPTEIRLTTAALRQPTPVLTETGSIDLMAGILGNTRQLAVLRLTGSQINADSPNPFAGTPLQVVAYPNDLRSRRTSPVITDVTGDGRMDVVVLTPELSALRVLTQSEKGYLVEGVRPSLQGVEAVVPIARENGLPGILLFSTEERAIGYAAAEKAGATLPFPRILPIPGTPNGLALLEGDEGIQLITILEGSLTGFTFAEDGTLSDQRRLRLSDGPDFPANARILGIDTMDLNRDGRIDLVVSVDFQPARFFLQEDDGSFELLQATSGVLEGLLAGIRPGNLMPVRLHGKDGSESILAVKERFARVFHFDESLNVVVEEQFNGRNAAARLVDAATANLGCGLGPSVVLLDRGNRGLTVYQRTVENGPFELRFNIPLDDAVYTHIRALDLDGDGIDDLVLTADDRTSILYSSAANSRFESIASVATTVDEGGYSALFSGALLERFPHQFVAVEATRNLLEFFELDQQEDGAHLRRFYQFRAFSTDARTGRRQDFEELAEPREMRFADLNGDGFPKVVCLMHDNIIIYYRGSPDEESSIAGVID